MRYLIYILGALALYSFLSRGKKKRTVSLRKVSNDNGTALIRAIGRDENGRIVAQVVFDAYTTETVDTVQKNGNSYALKQTNNNGLFTVQMIHNGQVQDEVSGQFSTLYANAK